MDVSAPLPLALKPAVRQLARCARFRFWRDFGGALWIATESNNSQLPSFLTTGELPETNLGHLSLRKFYDQLLKMLTGGDFEKEKTVEDMIRAAIRAQRGWDQPISELPRPIQELLDSFREMVIARFGGEIPIFGERRIPIDSPFRRFLERGELPKKHSGR